MKRVVLIIAVLIAESINADAQKVNFYPVISGYYASSLTAIDSVAVEKLDYIIYSFGHLNGNRLRIANATDSLLIKKMVGYKQTNPRLKVILSLGGWGGCYTCSPVFATKSGRKEFAQSVKELLLYFNADGIDLDWEYPAIEGYPGHPYAADDKANFTALIKILRRKLGKGYEISFAAGGFSTAIDSCFEWKKIMRKADKVNLMSYDLTSGFSKVSGHHTPLFSSIQQKESTNNAVLKMLQHGVPAHKIIIGAATYSRLFNTEDTLNDGLYRPASFRYGIPYKHLNDSLDAANGFVKYFDSATMAPYAFNPVRKVFATYDDSVSIKAKMDYVKKMKLGGLMYWQIMDDKFNGGLLDVMYLRRKENAD